MEEEKITESSGNVFEDLGFPDAQEALVKSKLAVAIYLAIKAKGLTQEEAAKIMETDQPHVSDIIRGKLFGYTIDRLLRFLLALGQDIEIKIKKHKAKNQRPQISVLEEKPNKLSRAVNF